MAPLGPRRFKRGVFRGFLDELKRTGMFDEVRAGASPELAAAMERPTRLASWIDHTMLEEILSAVAARGGRNAVREMAYNVIKHRSPHVLEPIIHFSLRVVGGGPASLLSRAQLMMAVSTQGIEMNWVPAGTTSGTMRIRCDEPLVELGCVSWEGTLVYVLELAEAQGTVSEGRLSADRKSCEIDVSWSAP